MNRLPLLQRTQILGLLVNGASLQPVSRSAGCSINTVTRLFEEVGSACAEYQDRVLQNLCCKRIRCDEIWSWAGGEQNTAIPDLPAAGDIWTWTAIDVDTMLIASWMLGPRNSCAAKIFVADIATRLASQVRLSRDGCKIYIDALEQDAGVTFDYADLIKVYGEGPEFLHWEGKPAEHIGLKTNRDECTPKSTDISTGNCEHQCRTMRMSTRRIIQQRNWFEKKSLSHARAVALHCMYYNFGRIHDDLQMTPAMAAGVSDHVWSLEEIAALVPEQVAKKRGHYRKR